MIFPFRGSLAGPRLRPGSSRDITNTPRFANPANSVNSGAFGEITSTLRGEGEREVQLALRLTF